LIFYFYIIFGLYCFPLFLPLFSILSFYMTLNLDDSWIDIENKFQETSYSNLESTKEPIESISLTCIYVGPDSCIQHVSKDFVDVDSSTRFISKDDFFHIIQNKRCFENKKYKLDDVLSFQVDLDNSDLRTFIDSSANSDFDFLKSVSYMNPIECFPSLFCFHDLACLYLIFIQHDSITSILKNGSSEKRVTKKVRILEPSKSCSRKFFKRLKRTLRSMD